MHSVTAIIDSRAPQKAIETLQTYCEVFLFRSESVTYDAISCHPDVFMFQGEKALIVAPNAPQDLVTFLQDKKNSFTIGKSTVGCELENSALYNCVETSIYFFHKSGFTDSEILKSTDKQFINLPQAYTRCSLMALNDNAFITSDRGIEKVLLQNGFDCFFVNPQSILLPPYKHGFIGGCMGILENRLFVIGSLKSLENADALIHFIQQQKLEIVELYDGQLYDGGGLFFV